MKAYHYTNRQAHYSMYNGSSYGEKGLLPIRRFVPYGRTSFLGDEAHAGTIEALLEPEPKYMTHSKEFPAWWYYLFFDICRKDNVMLLSFDIMKEDKAFVVERAYVERELYREAKGHGEPTKESFTRAYKKYFNTRIPALEYDNDFQLPHLAIWNPIPFERLHVEWVKPEDEVWDHVHMLMEEQGLMKRRKLIKEKNKYLKSKASQSLCSLNMRP